MTDESIGNIAYALDINDSFLIGVPGGNLPAVRCERCGEHRACGVEFPLVLAADFADFIWHLGQTRIAPVISWSQFEELNKRARLKTRDGALDLVPNCCLGPFHIKPEGPWPESPKDIEEASPGGPLFRRSLLEALVNEGIVLQHQPSTVLDSHGRSHRFGLVQPTVFRALKSENLPAVQYRQCDCCGNIKVLDCKKKPISEIPLKREFRSLVSCLFRVVGYDSLIFLSDTMKTALDQLRPSGLKYKPLGRWF